jgi:hypothetical protein
MIKDRITEMQRKSIREKLKISARTLYNWENNLHTKNFFKYLELLEILEIDPHEHLEEYKKKQLNK